MWKVSLQLHQTVKSNGKNMMKQKDFLSLLIHLLIEKHCSSKETTLSNLLFYSHEKSTCLGNVIHIYLVTPTGRLPFSSAIRNFSVEIILHIWDAQTYKHFQWVKIKKLKALHGHWVNSCYQFNAISMSDLMSIKMRELRKWLISRGS